MTKSPPRNNLRALITGITGQDGSYLAELLLSKGYEVWGMVRRSSSFNTHRIDHIYQDPHEADVRLRLCYGDLNDASSINHILRTVEPNEIYNLGAQSHVKVSFEIPEYTTEVTGIGVIRLLEAMREEGIRAKFYQASSSEQFGKVCESPQSESTPFDPQSPYAVAKVMAFHATRNYRQSYDMFAVNGIMFNHESPRRGETFVTRKISRAAARIASGLQACLFLGNLAATRDWGFAGDYVKAMWLMLQQDKPQDYVIATGESHSVREFCELCFAEADLPLTWEGEGLNETGLGPDGRVLVRVDPRYFRPAEVDHLVGDASKARRELGWEPTVSFAELAKMMVAADMQLARGEL
ncbi:GDP-mannose 4,6-dehydratase [Bythopirellula goksoeyrii]|uniref:GDP-mannose 4,6-dehydratase n=1 Tax=Bythopirellula goksoeyrii TaxID=1400387 RepID=A0A5B9QIM0_9BACT|nr:GDP-mannose 4,6-dehydratase [Bythopirellula goksoeyrii]QEG37849.1 GDP-mannose 4,6-dehydratase [Bythopirellula goksoeyrii]